jgi:hypothetical protein
LGKRDGIESRRGKGFTEIKNFHSNVHVGFILWCFEDFIMQNSVL